MANQNMTDHVVIFAGPSLFGSGIDTDSDPRLHWCPPARRGDVERLVNSCGLPGIIGLADGIFYSYPSVGHVELREAIEIGWRIFGLCSMGAIRAAEMRHMGLKPWGRIALNFCEDLNCPDDEVALIHNSEPPFTPLSEPMVHIREFLSQLQRNNLIARDQAHEIVCYFVNRWFGDRTLKELRAQLIETLAVENLPPLIEKALSDFSPYRIKQADLVSFVTHQPWNNVL
jgi:hypothetical protein